MAWPPGHRRGPAQRIARRKSVETPRPLAGRRATAGIVGLLTVRIPILSRMQPGALASNGAQDDAGNPGQPGSSCWPTPPEQESHRAGCSPRPAMPGRLNPSRFRDADDGCWPLAAITACALISGNAQSWSNLEPFLFHTNVNVRRASSKT